MTEINFRTAQFLTSAPSINECPAEAGSEVAFAGRSNAGKSSAINTLTDNKKLARTSKTPGRTQLINFFSLEGSDALRIVDLPGYGYAKVPLAMKKTWQTNMSTYLTERQCLRGLVLMIDLLHLMQELHSMMINWAVDGEMPVHILLTKSDKLKRGAARNTLFAIQKHMREAKVEDLVSVQTFSSLNNEGKPELITKLTNWLVIPDQQDSEAPNDTNKNNSPGEPI